MLVLAGDPLRYQAVYLETNSIFVHDIGSPMSSVHGMQQHYANKLIRNDHKIYSAMKVEECLNKKEFLYNTSINTSL